MRIISESLPQISEDTIQKWNKALPAERKKIVQDIIEQYHKPELNNIFAAIYANLDYHGIDPKKNPYIEFLDKLDFKPETKDLTNFVALNALITAGNVDLKHDYLTEKSLYDRSEKDFTYTVNIFETILDRAKLSKYFDNITDISIYPLYDDNNNILPAGLNKEKGNTIYNVIEEWDKEYNEPEEETKVGSLNYSLQDALNEFKVPSKLYAEVCKRWVYRYFRGIYDYVTPDYDDSTYYQERVFDILSKGKIKFSKTDRDNYRKEWRYRTLDDIPSTAEKEGKIVYIENPEDADIEIVMDIPEDEKYYIYHNKDWQKVVDYLDSISYKQRDTLLNTKSISIINDKASVTAGIVRVIDKIDSEEIATYDASRYEF